MDFIMPSLRSTGKGIGNTTDNNNFIGAKTKDAVNGNRTCTDYPLKVLNNLNRLRLDERFCDVEITAADKVFKAHRAVLSSSSPYFHAMFTGGLCEKDQTSVELHDVSPDILGALIGFVYTGDVRIDRNNVQELIVAADMLELKEVVDVCTEFLVKELHPSNAVGIYRFADAHNCRTLMNAAVQYISEHFVQVVDEKEMYELPKEQFVQFMSSEHLRVDSEFQVFQTAIRWIANDIVQRRRYVFEILKHVRLSLLSLGLIEKSIVSCSDSSLKVALRSIHDDLTNRRGCLVPLNVKPRRCAKKDIYLIGGLRREPHPTFHRGSENAYVSIERFDTYLRVWCKVPDMSVNRIVPGVAALNGQIYVVGGEQESNSLACGECFDPEEDAWTSIASMMVPRCEFGMCALDGYLYAMGGWVGEDIGGSIERYDPKLDEWRLAGSLPEPRFSMGVVSYEGLIYMVGGCSQNERYLRDLLSYNPVTEEWRSLPQMMTARSQMGVAILNDHLYVVGGDNRHQVLSSVERYSFKKNKWTSIPKLLVARSRPAVAAVDGLLYVIGGSVTNEHFYRTHYTISSVECYDPVDNTWSECPKLPDSRAEAGAVVI